MAGRPPFFDLGGGFFLNVPPRGWGCPSGGAVSELLAPGGNFKTAMGALKAGADAVYVGLRDFSARKGAENLDWDELRRLKAFTVTQGKKLFVAMNTLISESELTLAAQQLYRIDALAVDGVIVQDLGLVRLHKNLGLKIPLHGSTQLAAHNAAGVKTLVDWGFKRVVLARELSLEEVVKIRQAHPRVELEVFIHGALCYGVSGLCLASGLLLGRSANRGECAQICRTWFEGPTGKKYSLSTKDLGRLEQVLEWERIGIDSFKIEGRMKSAQYVTGLCQYYHALLEKKKPDDHALNDSQISFSRPLTSGFGSQDSLLADDFSGHRGIDLGEVSQQKGTRVVVQLLHNIEVRDGLLWFDANQPGQETKVGIKDIFYNGKKVFEALAGQRVELELFPRPPRGTKLHLIKHGTSAPEDSELPKKPYQISVNLKVSLRSDRWDFSCQSWGVQETFSIETQASTAEKDWMGLFFTALQSPPHEELALGEVLWDNLTGFSSLFVPPSALKQLKRELWPWLRAEYQKAQDRKVLQALALPSLEGSARIEALESSIELPPLQFDEEELAVYGEKLKQETEPTRVILNNVAHVQLAQSLDRQANLTFGIGYGLYVANTQAWFGWREQIPRLQSLQFWVEASPQQVLDFKAHLPEAELRSGPLFLDPDQARPPVFLSRICPRKHLWGGCQGCSKSYEETLVQRGVRWRLRVNNCQVQIFLEKVKT